MKLFVKTIRGSVFIVALSVLLSLYVQPSNAETTAAAVVDRYMRSLFSGDIESIQQCLAKSFQERRKNTFKDPGYTNFLINRYDGATYRILNSVERKNGSEVVDVEIVFPSSDKLKIRLLLNHLHKIIDERIL